MPIELQYQEKLVKAFNKKGFYAKKWATYYAKGVPDIIFVTPWVSGFIELKKMTVDAKSSPVGKKYNLTPRQRLEHIKIREAGGNVYLLLIVEHSVNKGYGTSNKEVYIIKPYYTVDAIRDYEWDKRKRWEEVMKLDDAKFVSNLLDVHTTEET